MDNKYRHLRTCPICEHDFIGVRRVCDPCRYREGRSLPALIKNLRADALAGHAGRIRTEMATIRRSGMNPSTATCAEVKAVGL